MRLHRFFVRDIQLKKDFWLHDEAMLWQWNKVLRFHSGQEIILFDGVKTERLYNIENLKKTEAHLVMVTELEPQMPKKHIYLFWSLLKKDNNELILQKATELGVSTFVPLISSRTIKKDFNHERATKIVTEASEQCGRFNIPNIREPMHLTTAIADYKDKIQMYVCHKSDEKTLIEGDKVGLIIGPEGGWSDDELAIFANENFQTIALGDFTLRAETAAIVASSLV